MFSRKFFATFCCFSLFCSAPKCQGSALGIAFKVMGGLEIMGGVSQAVTSMFTPDNRNIVSEEQKSKEKVINENSKKIEKLENKIEYLSMK